MRQLSVVSTCRRLRLPPLLGWPTHHLTTAEHFIGFADTSKLLPAAVLGGYVRVVLHGKAPKPTTTPASNSRPREPVLPMLVVVCNWDSATHAFLISMSSAFLQQPGSGTA